MSVPLRPASLFLVLVLAGCFSAAEPAEIVPASTTGEAPPPAPNEETGAVLVSVVTTELAPVPGAQVLLSDTSHSETTDANGRVTFNDVLPSSYTLLASKPGFRAKQEGGRLIDVAAGGVVETTFVLDPVPLVTADNSYHRIIPFKGFVACSVYVALVGNVEYCGRGVTYNGQTYLRDPNDNTTHAWQIDNVQARGWWLESTWQPTFPLSSPTLYFIQAGSAVCNPSCVYSKSFLGKGGPPPFRWLILEGEAKNITSRLGDKETNYPHPMVTHVRAFCTPSPCASVTWQQRYDAYTTVFYAQDPPETSTALPP